MGLYAVKEKCHSPSSFITLKITGCQTKPWNLKRENDTSCNYYWTEVNVSLHYTVTHYTTQWHITLHSDTLHYTVTHYTTQWHTILLHCDTLRYTVTHHATQWHTTLLHSDTLHYTVTHYTLTARRSRWFPSIKVMSHGHTEAVNTRYFMMPTNGSTRGSSCTPPGATTISSPWLVTWATVDCSQSTTTST